ncbi:MAG: YceD family protein [Paludibacteraceae bacterium]
MATQNPHIIELSKLEIGNYSFDYELDSEYFQSVEKSEVLSGHVQAKAELALRERDFDLRIKVGGTVQVTCDRCLDPMDLAVDAEEDMELDEGTETIDLEWLAYELVIVNLPLVHSHQPGGCNPQMDALLQDHLCTMPEDEDIDEPKDKE